MWLYKPLYELLPYFYFVGGLASFGAAMYLDYWHWPSICLGVALGCMMFGLFVSLRRREYRRGRTIPDTRGLD